MRFASYETDDGVRTGLVEGDALIDVARHLPRAPEGLRDLMEAGLLPECMSLLGRGLADMSLDKVRFAPLVPDARKIFLILLNYEHDRIAQGRPKLTYPHLLTRFPDSLVGHGEPLIVPRATAEFDFEGELAVVIGKGGRAISQEAAMDHVAGFTCFNDCGARDFMRHTRHFTAGKNFPASAGFGPFLVTREEALALADMKIESRLNGEAFQSGSLGDLTFGIPELIAYISSFTKLYPGDVIATGTPAGAGHSRRPPRFLKPGDVVDVTVTGIGTLTNTCIAE
jgi:2-keto-4-pentenoate hydratase/2-oxohepta-3-ene-1,7-dioic acid hydratase in catechol pathway